MGTESKNENLAASSRFSPVKIPIAIVEPERDIPGRMAEGRIYDNAGDIEIYTVINGSYGVVKAKQEDAVPEWPGLRVGAGLPAWVDDDNMEILGEGFGLLLRELYEHLDRLAEYDEDASMLNALLTGFLVHDWGRHAS